VRCFGSSTRSAIAQTPLILREQIEPETAPGDTPGSRAAPGETGLTFDMTWLGDALITLRHDHQDLIAADNTARTLATICHRRGLRIPDEVAIIGGGDEPVQCEGSEPELSSIDMGFYRAGYRAAELLDHLLRGRAAPAEPILTPPADLVARVSTDVYAVDDKTVGRAMRFIAEHCGQPIRVADVAEHVGCHRRKLEKQFRAAGRDSINNEIVALRIELTKRLLVSTDDSIHAVAAKAGYGTAQHLRHVFRHQLGTSPTAYRALHGK